MTPAMRQALHPRDTLRTIGDRLTAGGAVIEMGQLQRLSADEIDVLLRLERGL